MPKGVYKRTKPGYWKNKKRSKETIEKVRNALTGQSLSDSTKTKMSLAHKGKILSSEHKRKIGEARKGLKFTKEWRSKISLSHQREKNPSWKGGKIIDGSGYIRILHPKHPFACKSGYIKRSRLIMEKILERYLSKEEIVHHINRIRTDDRPKNLQLFANHSTHIKFHHSLNS